MRIFLFLVLIFPLLASAKVKNGTISGRVLDERGNPLPGAQVLAIKAEEPRIIRTTFSNLYGEYRLNNMPLGLYSLGFSKYGYLTIPAEEKSGATSSTLNDQRIRASIESGSHFRAQNVRMTRLSGGEDGVVVVTVIDELTSEKIQLATVTAGVTSQVGSSNGQYYMQIPLPPGSAANQSMPLKVYSAGYEDRTINITPVAGKSIEQRVILKPLLSSIEGRIDSGSLPVNLANASITVDGLPTASLNAKIDSQGGFSLQVPASNSQKKRFFDINVYLKGFFAQKISGVYAPEAGATTIAQTIVLQAQTTTIKGRCLTSMGEPLPSSANQVYVKEIGLAASVNGGSFFMDGVPTSVPLTLRVFLVNRENKPESADMGFTAGFNGTGVFTIPTTITSPSSP